MGNIITLDQAWLSLPVYTGAAIPSYPWWLNTALAIWTLLALFWCWFLIFLFLLQHCFRQRRQRQYNIDRKSLREQMFHTDGIKNQRNMYVPIVPLSLYDDIDNGLYTKRDDTTENIGRNIIKNYIITETKNYSVKKDLSSDEYDMKHNQEIQTPIVITVNMADEKIIDEPNWENAIPIEVQYYGYDNLLSISNNDRSSSIKLATAKIIFNMPLFFQQIIKYEKQPNIYIHQPQIQENNKKVMLKNRSQASDGNEKEQSSVSLKDEDEYKTTSTDILSSTLQNLILSYTQRESNLIADISREVTVTETIETLLLQLEQQHENSGFFIPLLSADISYERQTAIHYQSPKSTNFHHIY